jgi:phosphate transport system substrate-binding protein
MDYIDLFHCELNSGTKMKNANLNRLNGFVFSFLILFSAVALTSCSNEKRETLTSGSLTMITSEDVFPVIDIQVKDFQRVYEQVTIVNRSSSSRDAIVQMLNDSIKLIVCARELNEEELHFITQNKLEIDSIKIAYDGVAVIANKQNAIEKLSIDQLQKLLSGKIERWSGVKGSSLSSAVIVAMGDANSGVHEFVKKRVLGNEPLTSSFYLCSSSAEVFSIVKERPNVIGFVGTSWLKTMPDSVKALEIGDPSIKRDSTSTEMEYFLPHQAHIYRKYYPLTRTIYIYSHNVGKGVGLGFTTFAASSDGQKIIVSNGLVPATMPVRLVQLKTP